MTEIELLLRVRNQMTYNQAHRLPNDFYMTLESLKEFRIQFCPSVNSLIIVVAFRRLHCLQEFNSPQITALGSSIPPKWDAKDNLYFAITLWALIIIANSNPSQLPTLSLQLDPEKIKGHWIVEARNFSDFRCK